MYCPILCINPNHHAASFDQCMQEACAWWVGDGTTGKCAICQLGVYAADQTTG